MHKLAKKGNNINTTDTSNLVKETDYGTEISIIWSNNFVE